MKITQLTIALAAGLMLASCGTAIKMTEALPANLNLRRNATVAIAYNGATSDRITDYLVKKIRDDGYYRIVNNRYPNPDYTIGVEDIGESGGDIRVNIRYGRRGGTIYNNAMSTLLYSDAGAAEKIYHLVAPHEKEYTVRVSTSDENPELQQAVASCQVKNWDRGRELALQAIQKHPKDAEGYYLMALLERNNSNYAASNSWLQKALGTDPGNSKYTKAIKRNEVLQTNEANVIRQLSH